MSSSRVLPHLERRPKSCLTPASPFLLRPQSWPLDLPHPAWTRNWGLEITASRYELETNSYSFLFYTHWIFLVLSQLNVLDLKTTTHDEMCLSTHHAWLTIYKSLPRTKPHHGWTAPIFDQTLSILKQNQTSIIPHQTTAVPCPIWTRAHLSPSGPLLIHNHTTSDYERTSPTTQWTSQPDTTHPQPNPTYQYQWLDPI